MLQFRERELSNGKVNYCVLANVNRELADRGVKILTGEACNIGLRLLCDLTEDGVNLVEAFFSMTVSRGNYNSGSVKSVFLNRESMLPLLIFAVLRECPHAIFTQFYGGFAADRIIVFKSRDDYINYCIDQDDTGLYNDRRHWSVYHPQRHNPATLGNVHGFSGRSQ